MPDGDKRNKRNDSVKNGSFDRGQQLSDKLAASVSRGKMTYDQAYEKQMGEDKAASSAKKVGKVTSSSSQKTATKRKYTEAKFKLDRHGNKVAY